MAHNKTYGICESKCRTEVMSKSESMAAIDKKADTSHASSRTDHGVGSKTMYGHVKLTDNTSQPPTGDIAGDGVALAGTVGYSLHMQIKNAQRALQIPVSGIYLSSQRYSSNATVAELLGYGTWDYFGTLTNSAEKIAMYAYVRTE